MTERSRRKRDLATLVPAAAAVARPPTPAAERATADELAASDRAQEMIDASDAAMRRAVAEKLDSDITGSTPPPAAEAKNDESPKPKKPALLVADEDLFVDLALGQE